MLNSLPGRKSLLQRRSTLSTSFQAALDGAAVTILLYGITLWRTGRFSFPYSIMLLVLMGAMGVFYDRFAVYRNHAGLFPKMVTIGKAWTSSFLFLLAVAFVAKQTEPYSRIVVVATYISGLAGQALLHWAYQQVRWSRRIVGTREPVLIIGTGVLTNYLYDRIERNPWIREHVVGAVSVGDTVADVVDTEASPKVLGVLGDVESLTVEYGIRTVYIAVSLDASPVIADVYRRLLDHNVNIHWAPNIFALDLINHSLKELSGIPIITLSETPLTGTRLAMKNVGDFIVTLLAAVILSPVFVVAAVAIKLDSPGPVFFRQPRTGWDGKEFLIWKFRSMRVDQPETSEVKQATRDDPRVTRVGRFLRRTSVDELPQLLNVLAGQMSLVGPRPHAVQHNAQYAEYITTYMGRHRIKPGITGLAQVRGHRGETRDVSAMAKRVESDLEYINNWSPWLDASILVRTFFALFRKQSYENAY